MSPSDPAFRIYTHFPRASTLSLWNENKDPEKNGKKREWRRRNKVNEKMLLDCCMGRAREESFLSSDVGANNIFWHFPSSFVPYSRFELFAPTVADLFLGNFLHDFLGRSQ